MTVTPASIRAVYPVEFVDVSDVLLQDGIDRAYTRVDEAVLGDRYEEAVTLLACHLVANRPSGAGGRLTDKSEKYTVFWHDYMHLVRMHGAAWRLV